MPTQLLLILVLFLSTVVIADDTGKATAENAENTVAISQLHAKDHNPISFAELEAITTLAESQRQKKELLKILQMQLATAQATAEKEPLQQEIRNLEEEIAKQRIRLEFITTGISTSLYGGEEKPFNLRAELEGLFLPIIAALKNATEDSREIEELRQKLTVATKKAQLAEQAKTNTARLRKENTNSQLDLILQKIEDRWQSRLEADTSVKRSLQAQMDAKLAAQESVTNKAGKAFASFFKERGINLLLGLGSFLAVFFVMRSIHRLYNHLHDRRHRQKIVTFYRRLSDLIFHSLTFLLAIVSLLFVFNLLNDWLLLGITLLFLVASGWVCIKTLPKVMEQVVLLLNIGSIKEGERLIIDRLPWKINTLGFTIELINPLLEGGRLLIPIRHMLGRQSRPSGKDEIWFPTQTGDWVLIEDMPAKVISQTPDLVQLVELGGKRRFFHSADFIGQGLQNLSSGFRVEFRFRIDYRHQQQATGIIPQKMANHLRQQLPGIVDETFIDNVQVHFAEATHSSLDMEVEVDIKGEAADKYDHIKYAMMAALVDLCTQQQWIIPLQQLEVHTNNDPSKGSSNT